MAELEKTLEENKSVNKKSWLKEKLTWEMAKALDGEWSILQMIWDIENNKIRTVLQYYLDNKTLTPEKIQKEIVIYYKEVEPKLKDSSIKELADRLFSKKRFLPSSLVKEFQCRDKILSEWNPEVKELMKESLNVIYPSTIIENKDIYVELSQVRQPDEKNIISTYIKYWLNPEWVRDEYEDYKYIKESDSENARNLALSFINKWNRPTATIIYFDLFEKITEYWQNITDYILWIIDKREKEYTVEDLLYMAHYYKN